MPPAAPPGRDLYLQWWGVGERCCEALAQGAQQSMVSGKLRRIRKREKEELLGHSLKSPAVKMHVCSVPPPTVSPAARGTSVTCHRWQVESTTCDLHWGSVKGPS